MATHTTNTPISHANDAGFRAWVADFIELLDTPGHLANPGDTGQINTATATRPSVGNFGGYIVRRFNDALHATHPLFFRFDFGTGASAAWPVVRLTIGTGSNGSGTLTGAYTVSPNIDFFYRDGVFSTVTNYVSYSCGHPGILNVAFKLGSSDAAGNGLGFLSIERLRDSSGPTGDGVGVIYNANASSGVVAQRVAQAVAVNRSSGAVFGPSPAFCLVPQLASASAPISGSPRVFRNFVSAPEMRGLIATCNVIQSEVPRNSVFDATLMGTTQRTYISLGSVSLGNAAGAAASSVIHTPAMLYD